MSPIPRIDIHTHIIPEHLPKWTEKFGYGDFIHLEHHKHGCARMIKGDKFFREIKSNCWDAEQRIKECNEHHVHIQVLSAIPVMFNYWAHPPDGLETSRFLNDHIASVVQQHPDRFIGLGTIPMQSASLAAKELERCIKELGFAGVQIGSNVNQKNLSDPEFHEVWAAAQELNACIFVHPWEMMGQGEMQKYWLPWLVGMPAETSRAICSMIFGGVLEKFPSLRVAFAHGGGSFPFTLGRIEHGFNERPDLVAIDNKINPRNYLGKIYFDSLVHDKQALEYLIKLAGENFVCLGTDYPFPLGESVPGKLIDEVNLAKESKQKLFSDNAKAWLGRKTY
jgi:aminocarboxymuconate-semialdehyde decarboxylase